MSTPDRRLTPVVWVVDETQQWWEPCRDTPPNPAFVAALRAVLAHGAATNVVVDTGHRPNACAPGRHRRRIPLRHKEI